MLTINPEEEKTIGFVVEINGVGCDEMIGHVRFAFEGVEYGFPVSFSGDEILATIKPLNKLFDGKLKNGTILEARLDLESPEHNYYFNPWADEIEIKMPVSVEATIIEDEGKSKIPSVSVKAKPIKEVTKQKVINEEKLMRNKIKNITKEGVYSYMKRAGTKKPQIQELIYEQAAAEAGSIEPFKILKQVVKLLKKRK